MAETEGRRDRFGAETEGAKTRISLPSSQISGRGPLRRVVGYPHRVVAEARERLGGRLDDAATKLRSIDPLARRVVELEKRLDSLEKSAGPAPTRAKPASARAASKAPVRAESKQAEEDPEPPGERTDT